MGKNDWFGELEDDFNRFLAMEMAIDSSRDEDGRIDASEAAGYAMGLGYTSLDDMHEMEVWLGAAGAYDDDSSSDDDFFLDDGSGFSFGDDDAGGGSFDGFSSDDSGDFSF